MIIGYIGDIGSGKTLSMIRYAYRLNKKENRKIFANLHLKIKNSVLLNNSFFKDYAQSKFNINNACVLIDEAHVFIDSRTPMSDKNRMFSRFVTQSRKRGVDLIYTTQDINPLTFMKSGQVDIRLRKLTDRIILCNVLGTEDNLTVINKIFRKDGKLLKTFTFKGNPYYKLYDTYEIIDFNDDNE